MRNVRPKQYSALTQRVISNADSIEWEELPSLADSLSRRLISRGTWQHGGSPERGANDSAFQTSTFYGPVWDCTQPAALDPAPIEQPFCETISGLATREVNEFEVFQHFFGDFQPVR